MSDEEQLKRFVIDRRGFEPEQYPTHRHEPEFWEALGRCVATFGFLEETLAKAIFSFTATRPYGEDEIEQAYATNHPEVAVTLLATGQTFHEVEGERIEEVVA